MKEIGIICFILLLSNFKIFAQNIECERTTNFGKSEVCLPQIPGYQECYSDPIVKQLADATEVSMNLVLGFYLNDEIYAKKDSLDFISFDDYFKIYGTKEIKDVKANTKFLNEMSDVLDKNFFKTNWETIEGEIKDLDVGVDIGVPTVIKKYSLNDNSFTFLFLTKYNFEGIEPYVMAMSVNGLLLNDRLVWMAYYLNYEDEKTIIELQENSNSILNRLLKADYK